MNKFATELFKALFVTHQEAGYACIHPEDYFNFILGEKEIGHEQFEPNTDVDSLKSSMFVGCLRAPGGIDGSKENLLPKPIYLDPNVEKGKIVCMKTPFTTNKLTGFSKIKFP